MDTSQSMPSLDALTKVSYALREWLVYYKNIWTRNLAARLIDVACDEALKTKNPDEEVLLATNEQSTVKVRLEDRKISVQDAVDLLASIDAMLALSDEELAKKHSVEGLAVAEDMLPKVEAVTPEVVEPEAEVVPEAPAEGEAPSAGAAV